MNIITVAFDALGKSTVALTKNIQQGDNLTNQLQVSFYSGHPVMSTLRLHAELPDGTKTPYAIFLEKQLSADVWQFDLSSYFTTYAGTLTLNLAAQFTGVVENYDTVITDTDIAALYLNATRNVAYAYVALDTMYVYSWDGSAFVIEPTLTYQIPKEFQRNFKLNIEPSVVSTGDNQLVPEEEEIIISLINNVGARVTVLEEIVEQAICKYLGSYATADLAVTAVNSGSTGVLYECLINGAPYEAIKASTNNVHLINLVTNQTTYYVSGVIESKRNSLYYYNGALVDSVANTVPEIYRNSFRMLMSSTSVGTCIITKGQYGGVATTEYAYVFFVSADIALITVGARTWKYAKTADTFTEFYTTKTENALKADQSTTYTKTETDTLLDAKADQTTTYTKTEADTLLLAKADKTDTYTKTEVNNLVSSLYKYKGSVASYANLPSTGQVTGDVWNVLDSGINYAWNGTAWDDIGGVEALATALNDGLMSKEDFTKLNDLYTKANLDIELAKKVESTDTTFTDGLVIVQDGASAKKHKQSAIASAKLVTTDDTSAVNETIVVQDGTTGKKTKKSSTLISALATNVNLATKADKIYTTNLCTNGHFTSSYSPWVGSNAGLSVVSGRLAILATAQYGYGGYTFTTVVGHNYYIAGWIEDNTSISMQIGGISSSVMLKKITGNERLSENFVATGTSHNLRFVDNRASDWTTFYVDNVVIIDLDATFDSTHIPLAGMSDAALSYFTNQYFDGTVDYVTVRTLSNTKANKTQESWIKATLINGWTGTLYYRKDSFGMVNVYGTVSGTAGTVMFVLPTGYRPVFDMTFATSANNAFGRLYIDTSGNLYFTSGTATNVALSVIDYSTI